jgi:uncharacterized membrane protein YczE
VARIRLSIEVTVIIVGWLLGGTVGIGTVLFGVLVGYSVAFWFGVVGKLSKQPINQER